MHEVDPASFWYVPAAQLEQAVASVVLEYQPAAHSEQPPLSTNVPGSQRHASAEALPAGEDEPVGQAEQLPLPDSANVLVGHKPHAVAPGLLNVPGLQGEHEVKPETFEKEPAGHVVQFALHCPVHK